MNPWELLNAPAIIKVALFFGVWGLVWLPIAVVTAKALNWHPPQPLKEEQKPFFLALTVCDSSFSGGLSVSSRESILF
ncbi:CAAX amino terminal protease family domain protein [Lyngbya aestuarii BL J]|uniref:CAAX amino terminal protease family domain protein n=1 Tax=Lyngbya aestuarii BL J TaxID=1348334 RepID=U7QJG8_9CYAN|nr:hypothetical protein [Lyngbya aestuarii]ERT07387.1 CAAX amino terminal protease family domain protein [Lyngbya aestuarii BL J]